MKNIKIFCYFSIIILMLIEALLSEPRWYKTTDNKRFLIDIAEKYNWYQAFHECSRHDAQLVIVDTETKNDVLTKVLHQMKRNPKNVWIGGTDSFGDSIDNKRSFYWSPTEQELTFTNWASNQPDNFINKEHCIYIMGGNEHYPWNDIYCDTKGFGFICEEMGEIKETDNRKQITETIDGRILWGAFG